MRNSFSLQRSHLFMLSLSLFPSIYLQEIEPNLSGLSFIWLSHVFLASIRRLPSGHPLPKPTAKTVFAHATAFSLFPSQSILVPTAALNHHAVASFWVFAPLSPSHPALSFSSLLSAFQDGISPCSELSHLQAMLCYSFRQPSRFLTALAQVSLACSAPSFWPRWVRSPLLNEWMSAF